MRLTAQSTEPSFFFTDLYKWRHKHIPVSSHGTKLINFVIDIPSTYDSWEYFLESLLRSTSTFCSIWTQATHQYYILYIYMTSAHFAQHLFGQIGDLWPHACLKKEPLTDLSKWQRRIISSRMSDSINLPFKMEKWGGWGGGWCFTTWVERKDGQMSFHLFAKSTSCKQILWHPLTSLNIFLARLGTCDPMLVWRKSHWLIYPSGKGESSHLGWVTRSSSLIPAKGSGNQVTKGSH